MSMMIRSLLVLLIVFCLGCATQGGGASAGGGGSAPAPAPASGKGMLTDDDYKRIGIKETYENR